jgi:hypothetical protein
MTKMFIVRAIVIYFITSFFRRPAATPPTDIVGKDGAPALKQMPAWNFFENGTMFDMYVYVSEDYDFQNFSDRESRVWLAEGLVYGDWYGGRNGDGTVTKSKTIKPSNQLKNNGSIYMHVYVMKSGYSPDPASGEDYYAGKNMGYTRRLLNKFKKVRYLKTQNLLTGETEKSDEEIIKSQTIKNEILSHWHPNLTINLVTDQTNWVKGTVPPPLDEYVTFLPGGNTYLPIIFLNDYWNMMRDYQAINETTETLELYLTFQPLSLFKWQLYAAQAMRNKWTSNLFGEALTGGADETDEDQDSLKETLLDTNPYLLGMTIFVSILHSIFELLAFKNDIQFWKNRKSLEGKLNSVIFFLKR